MYRRRFRNYRRRARRRVPRRFKGYMRRSGFYKRFGTHLGNGGELKFLDTVMNDALVTGTVWLYINGNLSALTQGTAPTERIGRKWTLKIIHFKWFVDFIQVTNFTAQSAETLRIVLYIDKQCNGAVADAGQMWSSDDVFTWRQLENTGRFRILFDKIITMHCPSAGGASTTANFHNGAHRYGEFHKKLYLPIEQSSTTNAISTVRSNCLGCCICAEHGSLVAFNGEIRLRYSDK